MITGSFRVKNIRLTKDLYLGTYCHKAYYIKNPRTNTILRNNKRTRKVDDTEPEQLWRKKICNGINEMVRVEALYRQKCVFKNKTANGKKKNRHLHLLLKGENMGHTTWRKRT